MKRHSSISKQWIAVASLCCLVPSFGVQLQAADRGEIASGETRIANLVSGPPYLDTWSFTGNTGDRIIFYAVTADGAFDTTLFLYPPGGGPAEARGWATGYGGDVLDHQLQHTGNYTLVIQDYGVNDSGTYSVTFLRIPGAVSSTSDPDGGGISSGQTNGGRIDTASDLDAFQISANAGDRLIIHALTTSGSLDTTIRLYPPNGGPAEASGWMTGYGGDSLDWQVRTNGLYAIIIADYGLNDTGSYLLSVLRIPGPVNAPGDLDGGLVLSGQTVGARINVPSDLDAFQFYGNVGERVLIYAIKSSGALDTTVALYPPGGGAVEAQGWTTGYGGDSIDHQLLHSGLYTVVVADYGLSRTGDYTVNITKIPGSATGIYNPSPASGATIDGSANAFRWDPVPGATGYDLYLAAGGVTPLTKIGTNLASPSFPLSSLQAEQAHSWMVVAHTPSGDIVSPHWWFLVPRPAVQISRSGADWILFWPRWAGGFEAQATTNLAPADWRTLSGAQTNSERVFLQLPASGQSRYFRLQSP